MAKRIEMYSSMFCPFCSQAKRLLDQKGITYDVHAVDGNAMLRQQMITRSNRHTVPQIFVDDRHIGDCDEIHTLDRAGALDAILGVD